MADAPLLPTMYASPERSTPEELEHQVEQVALLPLDVLNKIPVMCVVLNEHRQIVFANEALLQALDLPDVHAVYGLRPGELLHCIHGGEMSGCGTTKFCQTCGAVNVILSSLRGESALKECRIVQQGGTALDLRVSGAPYEFDSKRFSLFTIEDISHEKRRWVLERLFFHDLLNLSGVLIGYSHVLMNETDDLAQIEEAKQMLYQASLRLVSEVKDQQYLSAAETGDLRLRPVALRSRQMLDNARAFYQTHEIARDRQIMIDPMAEDISFTSDQRLIERVLGNLVKNALEASSPGQSVTLSSFAEDGRVMFTVHNVGVMPDDVQLQMFQRSFSTKGDGRGVGAYSVKLITETYLQGRVSFISSPQDGTIFAVSYPKELIVDS